MPDSVLKSPRKAPAPKTITAAFLAGGGEMGRRMRALDFSRTALGDTAHWRTSLRTVVRILLTARQPMFLFWGERHAALYNDAAKAMVSSKHPQVLGQSAPAVWPELWSAIGAPLEKVRRTMEAASLEAAELPVESGGAAETTRLAISMSPVPDDDGTPGGVLCVLNETVSLHEAIIEISSELDTESLMQKVTDVATRMTRARFGAFFYNVKNEEGGRYRLFTLSGAKREDFEKLGMPRATAIFAPTFNGEGVVRLADVTKDPRYGKSGPHHGIPRGHFPVKSYLAVPVISRTREVLGGLFFAHPEAGMFDERAERIARAVAAHAGVAIDNAHLFGIARGEIEERSRVEIALRDSEARYRDLVEALPAAVYTTDVEGRIALFNEAAVRLWGRAPVPGVDLWCGSYRIQDPNDGEAVPLEECPMARVLRGEKLEGSREIVVERPDGTRRHVFVHPRLLRDGSGNTTGAINMLVDVTEQKRAERAVRESERLYRAIGESINYGVWVCNEKGHAEYVSESFLRLTGLTQQTYPKSIWATILHPEDAQRVLAQWKECVASGRDWEAQVQVRTASGGYRAILSRGVAIRDDDGRITGWAGMNLDIDRLKRVENELRELDQRKNEFLATLAHELRNPLAPIRNGLEIMRLGRGNAGMVEQARTMMERQLHQMVRLVDDLLDVSRVSRGKIELRRSRIELSAAISNAIETSKPLIDQNAQTLIVDLPDGPIAVDADLTRLSQVFANLLNNAAKYTEKGGRVELSARAADGRAEIRIKDNGIGIPREMLEHVFDIFTQVDRSLEKARGGLGIGLSIARRLVEMHAGTIVARSDGAGLGSEFIVTLPTVEMSREPAQPATPARRKHVRQRRILIADDNFDSATSLSLMLQVMGNEVRVAHDGLEALSAAESFHPDAVLLDIGMPQLNGYEVCRKLRERPATAHAMIVALTGWGQPEDRQKSREFGFDHHLVKPVEPRMLEALLATLGQEAE